MCFTYGGLNPVHWGPMTSWVSVLTWSHLVSAGVWNQVTENLTQRQDREGLMSDVHVPASSFTNGTNGGSCMFVSLFDASQWFYMCDPCACDPRPVSAADHTYERITLGFVCLRVFVQISSLVFENWPKCWKNASYLAMFKERFLDQDRHQFG